jgi:hypothetical protein
MIRFFRRRFMRTLVILRRRSIKVMRRLEARESLQMDQIQKVVYNITVKLIHDSESELRSNSIDYTYHIENDKYLIIIRPQSNNYSITLIEYKSEGVINNFDVPFSTTNVRQIVSKFEREVHKRMKSKMLMKTTKVVKHLQAIYTEIEEKDIIK